MSEEIKETREIHLKMGMKEIEKLEWLAKYYKELGAIEKPDMAKIIRYALNCLYAGTKREIESRRYGVK